MQQKELFTSENALAEHLTRCGLSRAEVALVVLIWREGNERVMEDGTVYRLMRISSRSAARMLRGTSPSTVVEAAGRVEKKGLMRIVRDGPRRPPLYVLSCTACRALVPIEDRLDELLADCTAVFGGVRRCSAVFGPTPVTPVGLYIQTSCAPEIPGDSRGGVGGSAEQGRTVPNTAEQHRAPRGAMPWSRAHGFTDEELVAAVQRRDVAWLGHLFDQAVASGHVRAPSGESRGQSDAWLRFLTLVHCVARRPYRSKRAALVAAVKRDIDVSRTALVDERWACAMLTITNHEAMFHE